jgi:hypothetical protein
MRSPTEAVRIDKPRPRRERWVVVGLCMRICSSAKNKGTNATGMIQPMLRYGKLRPGKHMATKSPLSKAARILKIKGLMA